MPLMNHMSLDVLAGIRRLTGSYSHFWRWARLEDTLSLATFLRACQLEKVQASSIETIEQAYQLALTRAGVSHERLTCWPEVIMPTPQEMLHLLDQLDQADQGNVDVTTVFKMSKDLRDRIRVHSYLLQSDLRVTPGKRAPAPSPRDLPREVAGSPWAHSPIEEDLPGQSPTVTP